MAKLLSVSDIKKKLLKQWAGYKYHQAFLNGESLERIQIKLPQITGKQLLHEYELVRQWLDELTALERYAGVTLIKHEVNYSSMGKQQMPVAIEFAVIESLARYVGKWQQWQHFFHILAQIESELPALKPWLVNNPAQIEKYSDSWPKLIKVCRHFMRFPQPGCYIRQLDIEGVDTKFIEQHKAILKLLLDQLLPSEVINTAVTKLSEHGFEKRFKLLYDQPVIRFRLLDPQLSHKFSGMTDISLPLDQFSQLELPLDKVFITENKVNGLTFPNVNHALVIFGLGYGIRSLKSVSWLKKCRLYYWGDIDSHGFAILSQLRSYFAAVESILMDEATLLRCRNMWGQEPQSKQHKADILPNLTESELRLYQDLKQNRWYPQLRLEQEQVPDSFLREHLRIIY